MAGVYFYSANICVRWHRRELQHHLRAGGDRQLVPRPAAETCISGACAERGGKEGPSGRGALPGTWNLSSPLPSSYDSSGASKDDIKERFAQTMEFVEEYLRDVVCQRFPFSDKEKNKLTFEVTCGEVTRAVRAFHWPLLLGGERWEYLSAWCFLSRDWLCHKKGLDAVLSQGERGRVPVRWLDGSSALRCTGGRGRVKRRKTVCARYTSQ